MSIRCYKFIISGVVQGVYYRANINKNALSAGFSGYVKNLPDSTVEAAVSCHETQLDTFIKILEDGSPNSKVTDIKQFDCEDEFHESFQIR